MSKRSIQFRYIIEKKDYNALRTYYMYRRTPERTKMMAVILLVSFLLLVLSETDFSFPFFKIIGLAGIVVTAAIYSWISIDTRKLENAVKITVNTKLDFYLDDAGMSAGWAGLSEAKEWDWAEMDHAYENDMYFFLFTEQYFALVIPKILLKEPQIKLIHQLLTDHIRLVSDTTGYEYSV